MWSVSWQQFDPDIRHFERGRAGWVAAGRMLEPPGRVASERVSQVQAHILRAQCAQPRSCSILLLWPLMSWILYLRTGRESSGSGLLPVNMRAAHCSVNEIPGHIGAVTRGAFPDFACNIIPRHPVLMMIARGQELEKVGRSSLNGSS